MANDTDQADEHTHLLPRNPRLSSVAHEADIESILSSHLSKDEQRLGDSSVGERLSYNDYTTIDWLHDLVSWSTYAI
jgi:chloride channel 3/4/5